MANRIVMGERSGQYGLWVSKPGNDVLTAGQDGLLLSMGEESLQAVYTGTVGISNTGAEVAVGLPIALPYTPLVLMQLSPRVTEYTSGGSNLLAVHTPRYRMLSSSSLGFSVFVGSMIGTPPSFTLTFTVLLKQFNG